MSTNVTPEQLLREKLRKIEALFGGGRDRWRTASAGLAADRIRARLDARRARKLPLS